jgi:hypothetical protein
MLCNVLRFYTALFRCDLLNADIPPLSPSLSPGTEEIAGPAEFSLPGKILPGD